MITSTRKSPPAIQPIEASEVERLIAEADRIMEDCRRCGIDPVEALRDVLARYDRRGEGGT